MKTFPETIEMYDHLAAIYPGKFDSLSDRQIRVRGHFLSLLRSSTATPSVLDVGCGTGRDVQFFGEHGAQVTGIDISGSMTSVARAKGLNGIIHGNFLEHDFCGIQFDGIWAVSILQDLPDERRVLEAIGKMNRLLKTKGKLYLVFPRFLGYPAARIEVPRKSYGLIQSVVNLSLPQLIEMLQGGGFRIISQRRSTGGEKNSGEEKEYWEMIVAKDA